MICGGGSHAKARHNLWGDAKSTILLYGQRIRVAVECNVFKGLLTHPATIIVIIAIIFRLVFVPLLTYDYDIYHWAQIIENFQTGNGLYDIDAYYYTPTWGYILGFLSAFMDAFLNVGNFGIRFTELLPVEELVFRFHTATTTTLAFTACMKLPLIIIDIITGYLLYRLVHDETGSEKKATFGLALWLFCPTVIYMSGIQAQFDSISALLMLLTIILLKNDRNFMAGMIFSAGTLLKFFPLFAIVVLASYVVVKNRPNGTGFKKLMTAIAGAAIIALVLYIPIIVSGDLETSLSFIIGRTGTQDDTPILRFILNNIAIILAIMGMVGFGYMMYKSPLEKVDKNLITYSLLALTGAMLMSATPQYMLVLLPILILVMMRDDGRMRLPWVLFSLGSIISAISTNSFMLLDGASAYLGLVSADWILDLSAAFETKFFNYTLSTIMCSIGQAIEYLAMLMIFAILFDRKIGERIPWLASSLKKIKRWDCEQ